LTKYNPRTGNSFRRTHDRADDVTPPDAALKESVTRVLASLAPREERVLRMRFGIGMNSDRRLEEVGQVERYAWTYSAD